MPHPLVIQLRFARSEFLRGLEGLTNDDACKRISPMNCISWNIGHMVWQEQRYWFTRARGQVLLPELNEKFCYGCPGFSPALDEMKTSWGKITKAADPYLDTLTTSDLEQFIVENGEKQDYTMGSLMQRVIYHYWFHSGENAAIRQMLGHTNLPDFVGNVDEEAPFTRY